MNSYCTQKNCIDVVVWDSLLQDGACNEEKYLEDMEKQLHKGLEVMMRDSINLKIPMEEMKRISSNVTLTIGKK